MKIIKTKLKGVLLIRPSKFHDERGFFYEHYNKKYFEKAVGKKINFVQDNFSVSYKGVFRGIHYQKSPKEQGKLVSVLHGSAVDYVVDLRKESDTYLKWEKFTLSDNNNAQLWIPEGFGHAFLATSDIVHFFYKVTNFYDKKSERCIRWDDPKIGLKLGNKSEIIISEKDQQGNFF